ncbi:TPA: hypothetical protein ACGQ50_000778 [Enterobacter cloacae]
MTGGYKNLSELHPVEVQALNGRMVNFIVRPQGIGFWLGHQFYTVDRVLPKSALPVVFTGGLLEFPNRKEAQCFRGRLYFQKNVSYYLLAIASRKERKAFALHLGKFEDRAHGTENERIYSNQIAFKRR